MDILRPLKSPCWTKAFASGGLDSRDVFACLGRQEIQAGATRLAQGWTAARPQSQPPRRVSQMATSGAPPQTPRSSSRPRLKTMLPKSVPPARVSVRSVLPLKTVVAVKPEVHWRQQRSSIWQGLPSRKCLPTRMPAPEGSGMSAKSKTTVTDPHLLPGRVTERFLYAALPGKPRIPINFGRQVACHLLGCEDKVDWRQCQDSKEGEKKLAVTLRELFKPFQVKGKPKSK
eukprot:g23447.t1